MCCNLSSASSKNILDFGKTPAGFSKLHDTFPVNCLRRIEKFWKKILRRIIASEFCAWLRSLTLERNIRHGFQFAFWVLRGFSQGKIFWDNFFVELYLVFDRKFSGRLVINNFCIVFQTEFHMSRGTFRRTFFCCQKFFRECVYILSVFVKKIR